MKSLDLYPKLLNTVEITFEDGEKIGFALGDNALLAVLELLGRRIGLRPTDVVQVPEKKKE